MSTKKNLTSKEKSKREHLIQIYLPVLFFFLIIVITGILVVNVSGTNSQMVQEWAGISVVLLIIPELFFVLITLAIIILFIMGLGKLLKWIPIHFTNLRVVIIKIAIFIMNGSNKIVFPFIIAKSKLFSLKSIWKKGRI